ncbi:hypothetical protein J6590_049842 [Homalodisca vitripennis]|nr:hypothetical protein J6590_049842 [Homalodisca vitripennis]
MQYWHAIQMKMIADICSLGHHCFSVSLAVAVLCCLPRDVPASYIVYSQSVRSSQFSFAGCAALFIVCSVWCKVIVYMCLLLYLGNMEYDNELVEDCMSEQDDSDSSSESSADVSSVHVYGQFSVFFHYLCNLQCLP